jgi:uncharacterized peroxidase-related enzyme
LKFYLKNESQVDSLADGQQPETLSTRARALTDYALKLTLKPSGIVKEDLEALRAVGISDSEILDLVLLTGYMNLVNRIAQGLGIEHDEQEAQGYKY